MPALSDDEVVELARRVIQADSRAVLATLAALDGAFLQFARLLSTCSGKVLVTGSGTSGAVAIRAAHLLSVAGTPAFHLSPADGLHGGLGVLRPGDIVLALSKGGASEELNDFCSRARALCGCLLVITASPTSALADHVIVLVLEDDADIGALVATGSSLAAAAVVDALVAVGRVARGHGWKDLLFTHPAGAVGLHAAKSLERLDDPEGP
jgi:D-arabinose 5-phosphate isomerase GutQ